MKIKREQLDSLAALLVAHYRSKELIGATADEGGIRAKIVKIVGQNFAEEDAIEEEARRVLATYGGATKDMDPYKMFLLAKQKVAAKKGFIL